MASVVNFQQWRNFDWWKNFDNRLRFDKVKANFLRSISYRITFFDSPGTWIVLRSGSLKHRIHVKVNTMQGCIRYETNKRMELTRHMEPPVKSCWGRINRHTKKDIKIFGVSVCKMGYCYFWGKKFNGQKKILLASRAHLCHLPPVRPHLQSTSQSHYNHTVQFYR